MLLIGRGGSALPLLQTRVLLIDHKPLSLADHDLAVLGASLDTAADLHGNHLRLGVSDDT